MLLYTYIVSVLVVLIDTWTKTPLPAAHFNSWSNSLPTTTCSGENRIQTAVYSKWKCILVNKFTNRKFKNFHSPEICHKFRVLSVFRSSTLVLQVVLREWFWRQPWLSCRHFCNSRGKQELNHCWTASHQVGSKYPLFFNCNWQR
jgi:hypothetical protein